MRLGISRSILSITLTVLVLLSPALAQDQATPKTLLDHGKFASDIATFLQIGSAKPAGYTWDGKTAFFSSSLAGAPQVFRINEQGWPYQLTTFEDGIDLYSGGVPYFNLSWGGDLAIVGASVGGSELSQLFLLDTHTGKTHQLTNRPDARYRVCMWAKDDRSIIYNSTEENLVDYHIYRMDIATGESKKIFGDTLDLAGSKYPVTLSQDGARLIVERWNSNADKDFWLLDLTSGEYSKINEDDGDVRYDDMALMPDNKTIFLLCNANDEGTTRLAKMKVGSPDVEFVEDGWLDPTWECDALHLSRDYKYMTVKVNQDGYMRLMMREIESRRELTSPPLDGQLGGGFFAEDGTCLISFEGPSRAPDIWRWNPETEELQQLSFSNYAGIDRELFSDPELIHYKSFDGLEIPAFLYLPPGYKEGDRIPFVVSAHGGPSSQFKPKFYRNFQYLILNGYGVLAPNPRGSGGYGREYMALDDYKLRKNSLKDYKAAVDWLLENNYTEQGRIGIRGGSYGGYVVLGMITEYPDLFDAAIDNVGIANFQSFLENTRPDRRKNRESEYGPLSDPEFLAEISPIHKAHLIKTPLLVIHGANDSRVPVGEARQIIQAIQDNGGVVDSLIFMDEGHGVGKRPNVITSYRRQVAFLDTQLKTIEVPTEEQVVEE
ncbi:MAG: prolyl oligopeptidase family serine peptidase [bacterium]|nr:prolyl oligopeptidase family serine peptidase [bacterium]